MITIIVIDFHSITRAGVLSILGEVPEFNIIGIAQSKNEAIDLLKQFHPTILLLDFQSINQVINNSEELGQFIKPSIKTLILNADNYQSLIGPLFRLGVSGILEKDVTDNELVRAIFNIAEGGIAFNHNQLDQMHKWEEYFEKNWQKLTNREQQILEWLSKGFENKQVAFTLGISIKTVSFHISNVQTKMNLNSRQDMVQWAVQFFSNGPSNLPG